jgi:hypothetical protein
VFDQVLRFHAAMIDSVAAKVRYYLWVKGRPRDHRQIHAIREALNQEWVLGREDFKDKIERMSKRHVRQYFSKICVLTPISF